MDKSENQCTNESVDSFYTESSSSSPARLSDSSDSPVSSTLPEALPEALPEHGELGGIKVDAAVAPHSFSSLAANTSIARELAAAASDTAASHSIESISSKTTTPDRSSSEMSEEERTMEQRKSIIREKINTPVVSETVSLAGSPAALSDLDRIQQKYISTLECALGELKQNDPYAAKIGEVVDFVLKLVEIEKNYATELALDREKKQGADGDEMLIEIQKAIAFSFQAIRSIKEGDERNFAVACSISKKNFSKFKKLECEVKGNAETAKFYNDAFECYRLSAESSNLEEKSHLLYEAGNHYLSAAQAHEVHQETLCAIHFSFGDCLREQAAISGRQEEKNQNAWNEFESASEDFSSALSALERRNLDACTRSQSSGAQKYKKGMMLLEEEGTIKGLTEKAQRSSNGISGKYSTKQTRKQKELLEKAIGDYTEAILQLRKGSPVIAQYYKEAGIFSSNGAREKIPLIIQQCEQVRDANLGIIEEEKKGPAQNNEVRQIFKSAIKYSKIAVDEIKRDQSKKDFIMSLEGASSNFLKAAQALQQGDRELADAHFNCAVSHCYLLVAREPRFINYLSPLDQNRFKKESRPNSSLIDYWENVVLNHGENIEALLQGRQ